MNPETIDTLRSFLAMRQPEEDSDSLVDTRESDPVSILAHSLVEGYVAERGEGSVPSQPEARSFVEKHLSVEGGVPEAEHVDFVAEKLVEILGKK